MVNQHALRASEILKVPDGPLGGEAMSLAMLATPVRAP